MPKPKLNKEQVRKEFLAGDSLTTIARRYGVDKSSVRGCLRRQGINTSGRATPKTDSDTEQRIIDLYSEYYSCEKVANSVGVCAATVAKVLEDNGISRRKPKKEQTQKRGSSNCKTKHCKALVLMLRTVADLDYSEIVKATGIPGNSVGNIIRRNGLIREKPVSKIGLDLASIEAEYVTGASCYELGEKYNVNPATISKWMRKIGHFRGKGAGLAVERRNQERRAKADANLLAEFGRMYESGKKSQKRRRQLRMALRNRDIGVNWRSLAQRNGSLVCEVCGVECNPNDRSWGSSGPTHPTVDHIVRICDGGEDTFENARLVCHQCNIDLNAKATREVSAHAKEQAIAHKCA